MEILILAFFALTTFVTRVTNLLKVPFFTDEAIYIRWAQIGLQDPAHRFISLTDGKQPLFTWFVYPMLKIFNDPLFAGRFVSVISGVFACIAIYFLTKELFSVKVAILACFIYIFSPFTLVYDRLALMDSLLAMFGLWSIFLSVKLAKTLCLKYSLLLGSVIGAAWLTKSSGLFYILLLPFSLLFFNFSKKQRVARLIRWIFLAFLSSIKAFIIYNMLRLSPWFYLIEQKNQTFIYTIDQFLKSPLFVLKGNLIGLTGMLFSYLTYPFVIILFLAFYIVLRKKDKNSIYLLICFLFPFLSLSFFGKVLFPRFILFMTVLLFPVLAKTIYDTVFKSKVRPILKLIILFILFIYPVFLSFQLIFSPVNASIHRIDRNQLFDDWPSGYGVMEVVEFFRSRAQEGPIMIGTEGTFGLNPAVYEIYLGKNENVEIMGFWPVSAVPEELINSAREKPTFLVLKETQEIPKSWPVKLIEKYRRGKGDTFLYLYEVLDMENQ